MIESTNVAYIELPAGVTFEIPIDYASYCGGHPVRVEPVSISERTLQISWSDEVIRFSGRDTNVEFDAHAVVGMVVNLAEEISEMEACTLRVGVMEDGGHATLLPILSSNPRQAAAFSAVVAKIAGLQWPINVFSSAAEMMA